MVSIGPGKGKILHNVGSREFKGEPPQVPELTEKTLCRQQFVRHAGRQLTPPLSNNQEVNLF